MCFPDFVIKAQVAAMQPVAPSLLLRRDFLRQIGLGLSTRSGNRSTYADMVRSFRAAVLRP